MDSVDLYPTYLQASKGMNSHDSTVATIIGTRMSFPFHCNSPLILKPLQSSTYSSHIHSGRHLWRNVSRLHLSIPRSPSNDHHLHPLHRSFHTSLDLARHVWKTCCRCILCAIWRPGGLGSYSDSVGRVESGLN